MEKWDEVELSRGTKSQGMRLELRMYTAVEGV
jgi:hypothetical protein